MTIAPTQLSQEIGTGVVSRESTRGGIRVVPFTIISVSMFSGPKGLAALSSGRFCDIQSSKQNMVDAKRYKYRERDREGMSDPVSITEDMAPKNPT